MKFRKLFFEKNSGFTKVRSKCSESFFSFRTSIDQSLFLGLVGLYGTLEPRYNSVCLFRVFALGQNNTVEICNIICQMTVLQFTFPYLQQLFEIKFLFHKKFLQKTFGGIILTIVFLSSYQLKLISSNIRLITERQDGGKFLIKYSPQVIMFLIS